MTLNALWRLIRTLLVALGAPACMVARLWRRDEMGMRRIARLLARFRARGLWLRYDGEDDATVIKRIERLKWMARNPHKAVLHMARRGEGFRRHTIGAQFTPIAWAPPMLQIAALKPAADACAGAPDTS